MDVPDKRPQRDEYLMMLSGLGQIATDLDSALKYKDRARYVQIDEPSKHLKKLRLRKLELGGAPPAWIGELTELRTLQCLPDAKLPSSLFTLPKLRFLHLDGSDLANLDGIDRLPALETVTFSSTPLATDEAIAKLLGKLKGATRTRFITGLEFERTAAKPPKSKATLLAALRDGSLPDETDLRKVDLSGETFEDLLLTHDLRNAKLANTTWLRCDFDLCALAGADLTGATFYDCYFSTRYDDLGNLGKVKAARSTWVGCGGSLEFGGADLRDAKLLDMDPDVALGFDKVSGQGLTLEASFCSEKEHQLGAKAADLRGARVRFDITESRRSEIVKKKAARLAWKQDHLKGAKTDKTTQIEYAPLDANSAGKPTRAAEQTVDPKGKAAPILGVLHASNASLWCVVADSVVAAGWRGAVDETDRKDDFQRALKRDHGRIEIGDDTGVVFHVGYNGFSNVYAVDHGFLLLDSSESIDDKAERDRALALRVGQWKIWTKPKAIGKVVCPSGILAVMLPYRDGAFSAKELAKARTAVVVDREYDRLLVPMASGPGIYEIASYPFKPDKSRGEYEDDVGSYGNAYLVTYRDRLPKKYRA